MANELDTRAVITKAWEEGKTVFVPRVMDDHLVFLSLESFSDSFDTGSFGIREPKLSRPRWHPLSSVGPTLVLAPGLAFDLGGGRLGRGGGYYDRFLSEIRLAADAAGETPPVCLGFAFDQQVFDNVPMTEKDERMDGLVTDKRTILLRSWKSRTAG